MDDQETEQFRLRLVALRAEIQAVLEGGRASTETVELDQSRQGRLSRMDALQGQAMAQASQARARQQLRRIDAALSRCERGEFGECQDCGEDIPSRRLEVDPAATLCVGCAERRESVG